jgi:hypothetical protein
MYASLFGMSGALHLAAFEQPARQVFFGNLGERVLDTGSAFPYIRESRLFPTAWKHSS